METFYERGATLNDREPSVFISYATPDAAWANWICHELLALSIETEMDKNDWRSGDGLVDKINDAILKHKIFLPIWSTFYFSESRWTQDEIKAAYNFHRKGALNIVPFNIEPDVNVPPLFATLISTNLYGLAETAARYEFRRQLEKYIARPLKTGPVPQKKVQFPGAVSSPSTSFKITQSKSNLDLIEKADEQARLALSLRPQSIDPYALENLANEVRLLSRSYNSEPPSTILHRVLPLNDELDLMTEVVQHSPARLADVFVMKSRVLGLESYAALDMGDPKVALRSALAMTRFAEEAGHTELTAWGLGTQSMILRFDGDIKRAQEKTRKGLDLHPSGMAAARLHCQAALNWSEIGDLSNTRGSLDLSEQTVEGQPQSPDEADGIFFFSLAKHHYYAGCGYLKFEPIYASFAERESRQAIALFSEGNEDTRSVSDELLAIVHLTMAIARQGRIDEILGALQPLLRASIEFRTAWHYLWLQRLVTSLNNNTRFRNSEVLNSLIHAVQEFSVGADVKEVE